LLRLLSLFTSDAKRLVIRLSIAILKRRYRNVRAAGRERHTPTSQLDWLISTTAMIVESWKATRHCSSRFGWYSISQLQRTSPCPPFDSISHRVVRRLERKWEGPKERDPLNNKSPEP
jgi:hypothetical protein